MTYIANPYNTNITSFLGTPVSPSLLTNLGGQVANSIVTFLSDEVLAINSWGCILQPCLVNLGSTVIGWGVTGESVHWDDNDELKFDN